MRNVQFCDWKRGASKIKVRVQGVEVQECHINKLDKFERRERRAPGIEAVAAIYRPQLCQRPHSPSGAFETILGEREQGYFASPNQTPK